MNSLKIAGKFLDQPNLLHKFKKTVPAILITGGAFYAHKDIKTKPQSEKGKATIKNIAVLSATIASALAAPHIADNIIKLIRKNSKNIKPEETIEQIRKVNTKLIDEFTNNNSISKNAKELLNKSKEKILHLKEIKQLFAELKTKEGQELLDKLIPDPEIIGWKDIASEIGKLSIIGLVPILGGITGGIVGDRLTEENWKERIPNKIKEGSYQYLANIFLCNIGAMLALMILEKKGIHSKSARALGMVTGILITGVLGGSTIANFIGKKVINPMFNNGKKDDSDLFSERKPEPIDIGLHTDDIATVAIMSGLKWIEPSLPMLYSISGYRAGIGYRNGHKHGHRRGGKQMEKYQDSLEVQGRHNCGNCRQCNGSKRFRRHQNQTFSKFNNYA